MTFFTWPGSESDPCPLTPGEDTHGGLCWMTLSVSLVKADCRVMASKTSVFGTLRNLSRNICGLRDKSTWEHGNMNSKCHNRENKTGKMFDPKVETQKDGEIISMKILDSWEKKHGMENWKTTIKNRNLDRENYNGKPFININYWYKYGLVMNSRSHLLIKFDSCDVDGQMLGKMSSSFLHSDSLKSALAPHYNREGKVMDLAIVDIDKIDDTLREKLKKELQIQDLGIGLMGVKNGKVVDWLFGAQEVQDKEAISTFIQKLILEFQGEPGRWSL